MSRGAVAAQRIEHDARDRHRVIAREVDRQLHRRSSGDLADEAAAGEGQPVVQQHLVRDDGLGTGAPPTADDATSRPPSSASGTDQALHGIDRRRVLGGRDLREAVDWAPPLPGPAP